MLGDLLSDLAYRLRVLFQRDAAEHGMDEELQFHIDRETEQLVRAGLPPDEARRRARLSFGGVDQVKEAARDAWGTRMIDQLRRDAAQSLRVSRKQPWFSSVVIVSLALGLAAALTVVNIAYNVLFAPLALPRPNELVTAVRWTSDDRDNVFTWSEVQVLRAATGATIAAMRGASSVAFRVGDRRLFINLDFVDGNFFSLLEAQPLNGRLISERDDAESAPVVVLSRDFAEQLFPGDSSVVGKTVDIRGTFFTVIGVTPESYRGVRFPAFFSAAIPMGAVSLLGANGVGSDNRGVPYGRGDDRLTDKAVFQVIGRVTGDLSTARQSLGRSFERCCGVNRSREREWLELVDMSRGIPGGKGDIRREAAGTLAMILGGVGLILVVVCCNVASLLLVRSTARQREIAVRLSLGASRARLCWQLVAETVPLALAGGAGGLVMAAWFTSGFVRGLPSDLVDIAPMLAFNVNPLLIAIALGLTGGCVLAFAVYPAWRATARPLAPSLRIDARSSRSRGQGAVARGVIVGQVAVTVVLVTSAALLSATLINLSRVDPGVSSDRMLLASIGTRSTSYEARGIIPVAEQIARSVEATPGVRAATMATLVPLYGGANSEVRVEVPGFVADSEPTASARLVVTRTGYFKTSGLRIVAGQEFGSSNATQGVAVVNEAFVRRYVRNGNPVGLTIGAVVHESERAPATPLLIVGVSANAAYETMKSPRIPYIYVPLAATTSKWFNMQLVVRTDGAPGAMTKAVLRAIEAAAPGIDVRRVRDMKTQLADSTTIERLTARLAVFVSAMALVLATIGLYGVVAYGVSRRVSEIGVRLALGARTRAILWLVTRETALLLSIGIVIGTMLSWVANGAIASQFFGVAPRDPRAIVGAAILLALVGLVASIVPAQRATRIDPRIALSVD
jgi:predicted permease